MSILIVAGKFDMDGGRPSGYIEKLAKHVPKADLINGGHYDELPAIVLGARPFKSVWWFADVPNDLPKVVKNLKDAIPHSVLVISKNNMDQKYQYIDLVGRMFQARANLSMIVESHAPFQISVIDPLGNMYLERETDVAKVAKALVDRVNALIDFTRMGSKQIGDAIEVPDEAEFFDLIRGYATRFHELVHGVNPSRLLGNASFRCTRGGFPAFLSDGKLFISKRNLDKREIGRDGFVAIEPSYSDVIAYYGERKPSVDAPIQRALFNALPWAKYMLHSHTYIDGAPFTDSRVPCGALEEVPEVVKLVTEDDKLYVNLTGHGCLAIGSKIEHMRGIPFIQRTFPERV